MGLKKSGLSARWWGEVEFGVPAVVGETSCVAQAHRSYDGLRNILWLGECLCVVDNMQHSHNPSFVVVLCADIP